MGTIMLKVICWKWFQEGYRSVFNPTHVHTLESMLRRNLDFDFEFLCITDDPTDLKCKTMPLWDEPKINLPQSRPNCYRRLKLFSSDAAQWIGADAILSIDLDVVIVSNITDLVVNMLQHDFSIWGDTAKNTHYNGSFWSLKLGTRPTVWSKFDPKKSPILVNQKGIVGSDQGWISYHLGEGENKVTAEKNGVLSYRNDIIKQNLKNPPKNTKLIFFHGNHDPQSKETLRESPWISNFYL